MAILKDALVQGDLVTTGNIRGDELSATAINVSKGVANVGAEVTVERSDTGVSLFLGVGSGGTNHGVYSNKLNKWMVYADSANVYLNGTATSANTSTTRAASDNSTNIATTAFVTTAINNAIGSAISASY